MADVGDAGHAALVEDPGYAALFDMLRARGLALEAVAVDPRGMRPQELGRALERGASAVIITPRGQNPTGSALDAGRARELRVVLAGAPQALVIEDDHLGPLAGRHAPGGDRQLIDQLRDDCAREHATR